MKSRFSTIPAAIALFAALATLPWLAAQEPRAKDDLPRYRVKDLGTFGGTFSSGRGINNKDLIAADAFLPHDDAQRAFLLKKGHKIDLGTLGGPNTVTFSKPNEHGELVGGSDTSNQDPLGEDFCFFGTHLTCLAFVWQKGAMTALPNLGGNNGTANYINNHGQVAGVAENTTLDSTCSNSEYQAEPVIWNNGVPTQLPTVSNDPDGNVSAINDQGVAVGGSGDCATGPALSLHAVLWQNGSAMDLGSLGGTLFSDAFGINSRGQVVGASDLPGDTNFWAGPFINNHAFLWQNRALTDLGTLAGDAGSWSFSINRKGQIVGFGSRAILWSGRGLTDLNTLVPGPPFSPLYLLQAWDINDRSEIVGEGIDINGELHAYLAIPCDEGHGDVEDCHVDAGPNVTKPIQPAHVDTSGGFSAVRGDPRLGHLPAGTVIGRRPEGLAGRYFSNLPGAAARQP